MLWRLIYALVGFVLGVLSVFLLAGLVVALTGDAHGTRAFGAMAWAMGIWGAIVGWRRGAERATRGKGPAAAAAAPAQAP